MTKTPSNYSIFLLFLFGFIFVFSNRSIRAQKLFHSLGPNISLVETGVFEAPLPYVAVSYTARFNVYEKKDYAVSIGMPINIGALVFSNPGKTSEYFSWEGYLVSIPAVINFNWGADATKASSSKLGYFLGAGPGYLYRQYSDLSDQSVINGLAGTVNTGLRFKVGRRPQKRMKYMELRGSYTLPFQNTKQHLFGAHLLFSWRRL